MEKEYNLKCSCVCLNPTKLYRIIEKDGQKIGLCQECFHKLGGENIVNQTTLDLYKTDNFTRGNEGKNYLTCSINSPLSS